MSSLSDSLLIDVRGWLKLATGVANDRVIPADDGGTRPDLPYLTVQFVSTDLLLQHDETVRSLDAQGEPQENIVAHRTGTLQVDGYGIGSDDLIALAGLSLRTTEVKRFLRDKEIAIRPVGGITDLSTLVDDAIEKRFSRDFTITYAYTLDDDRPVEGMDQFEGEFDFDDQNLEVIE